MTTDKSTLYRDSAGEWRWRRVAANGDIVGASTEGYEHENDARANYLRNEGLDAPELIELGEAT